MIRVVVCGVGPGGGVGALLSSRLRELGEAEPFWLDLDGISRKKFEEVDALLAGCSIAVVCPDADDDSPSTLEAALRGLKVVLQSGGVELKKVILLSRCGAQSAKGGFNLGSFFGAKPGVCWADLEDELTSSARLRSSSSALEVVIVRRAPPLPLASARVACLPAEAAAAPGSQGTTSATAAEACFQALALGVNTSFTVLDEASPEPQKPDWSELLLPFVGPEVWRKDISDAKRAAIFAQNWAEEFFGKGKRAARLGVKTPVLYQLTASGVIFKFCPLDTEAGTPFESLNQGGLEFTAEQPATGSPRLRAVRCAYGWKVTVKLNSEQALLEKFSKDWAEVESQAQQLSRG